MKRSFLYLIPCLALTLLFTRCSKEQSYSCDEKVDAWVKDHKAEVLQMSRTEILASDALTQQAIFRASPPEKKYSLWLEKIAAVQRLDWNEQEQEHLQQLKGFLSVDLFENEETKVSTLAKLKTWKAYAMDVLKWEQKAIAAIAGTLATPINKDGDFEFQDSQVAATDVVAMDTESEKKCTCNKSSDFCNGGIAGPNGPLRCTSPTPNCNSSSSGCGWLFLEDCNGTCL